MSAKTFSTHLIHSIAFLLIALLFATPSVAARLSPRNGACATAVPLEPGDTWRNPGSVASVTCFTIMVDRFDPIAHNALVVELLLPATAPRAHVTVVDPNRTLVLHQTASTVAIHLAPGQHRIRVATDDPVETLSPFRLDVSLTSIHTRDEDDTELELEPDPLMTSGPLTKDEDDTELELEPDPFMAPVDTTPSDLSILTSSQSPVDHNSTHHDDHGDTFLRATPITFGQATIGALTNDWGDDVDIFRFDVTRVGPVTIEIESNAAVDVELFDRHGLRIDWVTSFDVSGRMVRTLVPGRYFVRIATSGGNETRYALAVNRTSDR